MHTVEFDYLSSSYVAALNEECGLRSDWISLGSMSFDFCVLLMEMELALK